MVIDARTRWVHMSSPLSLPFFFFLSIDLSTGSVSLHSNTRLKQELVRLPFVRDTKMAEEQPHADEDEWMQTTKQGPLVSDPMSALCLKTEYAGNANENFMFGIDSLHRRYDAMRRVRGDGNCFFRAFIFALCEQLLNTGGGSSSAAKLRARIEEKIRASKAELIAIGYSEIAIDAFWETFVDYLAAMETRSHAELYPSVLYLLLDVSACVAFLTVAVPV